MAQQKGVSYETTMVTQEEYRAFQVAYDFFNQHLFAQRLPQVLVTLQRRGRSKGYFAPERFTGRQSQSAALIMAPATSYTFRLRNGVTQGHARAGQHAVCDTGYTYYVILLISQGYPRRIASYPIRHAQPC
jgi:hypothetical protein